MRKLALALALVLCLLPGLPAKGVRYGMTPDEVEEVLGKPTARLTQGNRLVLVYPKNGRVEFEQGAAVRILNVALDTGEPAPPGKPATPPAAPGGHAKSAPGAKEAGEGDETGAIDDAKAMRARQDFQKRLEEATEKMEADSQKIPLVVGPKPGVFWSGLVIGLVARTFFTAVALKMAFKWSDVHADWGQMFIPALADTIAQATISAVVFALWKTDQLFHLDLAVSYFVLLGVLMKTTHACTLQRAVAVAGAAKLASLVLMALLSLLLASLFHP